jgi:hypothetical protein
MTADGRYIPVVSETGQMGSPGSLVLLALEGEHPALALHRASRSPRVHRLLTQLFVVALRRCFTGHDAREITGYVYDLLVFLQLPARGVLARQTEGLIRAALGEPALAGGIPADLRHRIVCAVVGDLARPPGADRAVLARLIEQAEQRVDRLDRPAPRRAVRRRR